MCHTPLAVCDVNNLHESVFSTKSDLMFNFCIDYGDLPARLIKKEEKKKRVGPRRKKSEILITSRICDK